MVNCVLASVNVRTWIHGIPCSSCRHQMAHIAGLPYHQGAPVENRQLRNVKRSSFHEGLLRQRPPSFHQSKENLQHVNTSPIPGSSRGRLLQGDSPKISNLQTPPGSLGRKRQSSGNNSGSNSKDNISKLINKVSDSSLQNLLLPPPGDNNANRGVSPELPLFHYRNVNMQGSGSLGRTQDASGTSTNTCTLTQSQILQTHESRRASLASSSGPPTQDISEMTGISTETGPRSPLSSTNSSPDVASTPGSTASGRHSNTDYRAMMPFLPRSDSLQRTLPSPSGSQGTNSLGRPVSEMSTQTGGRNTSNTCTSDIAELDRIMEEFGHTNPEYRPMANSRPPSGNNVKRSHSSRSGRPKNTSSPLENNYAQNVSEDGVLYGHASPPPVQAPQGRGSRCSPIKETPRLEQRAYATNGSPAPSGGLYQYQPAVDGYSQPRSVSQGYMQDGLGSLPKTAPSPAQMRFVNHTNQSSPFSPAQSPARISNTSLPRSLQSAIGSSPISVISQNSLKTRNAGIHPDNVKLIDSTALPSVSPISKIAPIRHLHKQHTYPETKHEMASGGQAKGSFPKEARHKEGKKGARKSDSPRHHGKRKSQHMRDVNSGRPDAKKDSKKETKGELSPPPLPPPPPDEYLPQGRGKGHPSGMYYVLSPTQANQLPSGSKVLQPQSAIQEPLRSPPKSAFMPISAPNAATDGIGSVVQPSPQIPQRVDSKPQKDRPQRPPRQRNQPGTHDSCGPTPERPPPPENYEPSTRVGAVEGIPPLPGNRQPAPPFQVKRRQRFNPPPRLCRSLDYIPSDLEDALSVASRMSSRVSSRVSSRPQSREDSPDMTRYPRWGPDAFVPLSSLVRQLADNMSVSSVGSSEMSRSDPALNYDSGSTAYESEYDNYRPGMASDEDYFIPEPISDIDIDYFDDINIDNVTVSDTYSLDMPMAMSMQQQQQQQQQKKVTEV